MMKLYIVLLSCLLLGACSVVSVQVNTGSGQANKTIDPDFKGDIKR